VPEFFSLPDITQAGEDNCHVAGLDARLLAKQGQTKTVRDVPTKNISKQGLADLGTVNS